MTEVVRKNFASLDAVERQRIASLGGKKAHELGKAHTYTSETAKLASAKGVAVRQRKAAERAALRQQNAQVQK
jgi:hypothetical protein